MQLRLWGLQHPLLQLNSRDEGPMGVAFEMNHLKLKTWRPEVWTERRLESIKS